MRVPTAEPQRNGNLAMMSMIDVVFLLLVFFIWTSSFEMPEFDLPGSIAMPPPKTASASSAQPNQAPAEPFDEIVLRILGEGSSHQLQLNDLPMADLDQLRRQLTDILALDVSPPVIVDPDPEIPIAVCVSVYDAARASGADRVLMAARAEPSP